MAGEEQAIYQPLSAPPPGAIFMWGGGFLGLALGLQTAWFANDRPLNNLNSATAIGWPAPGPRRLRGLRVKVYANLLASSTTFEITVDGVGTGIIVTVGAGTTGVFADTTNTYDCATGAEIGLCAKNTSGGIVALTMMASAIAAPAAPPP